MTSTLTGYYLAGLWTANNDARSYVIIGDPAVRLPVLEASETAGKRPEIDLQSPSPPERLPAAPVASSGLVAPVEESQTPEAPAAPVLPAEALTAIQNQLDSLMLAEGETRKSITVSTYISSDLANPDETGLKAQTRISLTIETSLSESPRQLSDQEARRLKLHEEMVREALNVRLRRPDA